MLQQVQIHAEARRLSDLPSVLSDDIWMRGREELSRLHPSIRNTRKHAPCTRPTYQPTGGELVPSITAAGGGGKHPPERRRLRNCPVTLTSLLPAAPCSQPAAVASNHFDLCFREEGKKDLFLDVFQSLWLGQNPHQMVWFLDANVFHVRCNVEKFRVVLWAEGKIFTASLRAVRWAGTQAGGLCVGLLLLFSPTTNNQHSSQ